MLLLASHRNLYGAKLYHRTGGLFYHPRIPDKTMVLLLGKLGKDYEDTITGGISVPGYSPGGQIPEKQCIKTEVYNIVKCKKAYSVNNTGKN